MPPRNIPSASPPDFPCRLPSRRCGWSLLLPTHRRTVVAKTPLLVALGSYLAGARSPRLLLVTMALAALLWTVLYALNEATDLREEQGLRISPGVWLTIGFALAALSLVGALISTRLALLMTAMVLGQCLYCMPPARIKRRWWAFTLLSGAVNPILRVQCGAILGAAAIPAPAYIACVCLHVGASLKTRVMQRKRDRELGYSAAPAGAEPVGIVCTVLGFWHGAALCVDGALPRLLLAPAVAAAAWSVYAWSGKVTSMDGLRRGWLPFALLSLFCLGALLTSR
ncbi:MAG TPA: hypothetical protein VGS41_07305 [Chthonomonadales bacterium]|nr:hypothetical protein [Chthonomonadales bacterium]